MNVNENPYRVIEKNVDEIRRAQQYLATLETRAIKKIHKKESEIDDLYWELITNEEELETFIKSFNEKKKHIKSQIKKLKTECENQLLKARKVQQIDID